MAKILSRLLLVWLSILVVNSSRAQNIITLTWSEVVARTQTDNLDLNIQRQDYRYQRLNEWKAVSDFLPTVDYSFRGVNNIELPEFVLYFGNQAQRIKIGTDYNFSHVFQLQYPLFLGGLRFANYRIQHNVKKSLSAQLRNKEEEVVLQALEAYFNVMLAEKLIEVNQRAYQAARANLEQVEKFYELGAASQLDYLRAKSRYSSTIAPLTSAKNAKKLALENLKFILNLPESDSLVIADTLAKMEFLEEYQTMDLERLQEIARKNRADLRTVVLQQKATRDQQIISASQFLPSVFLTADVQHQAQLETRRVAPDDFIRSKSVGLVVQVPLFQGGKRGIEFQQSRILNKKARLQVEQVERAVLLDVENSKNQFNEAQANLASLQQAMLEAREALRLANLTYREGISTQVDVLNAQLAYTSSETQYQQGVFQYNIAQLRLLKAIGKLHSIWS
ncbi:MAG: TolC family protein [Calditrichia bacterium]